MLRDAALSRCTHIFMVRRKFGRFSWCWLHVRRCNSPPPRSGPLLVIAVPPSGFSGSFRRGGGALLPFWRGRREEEPAAAGKFRGSATRRRHLHPLRAPLARRRVGPAWTGEDGLRLSLLGACIVTCRPTNLGVKMLVRRTQTLAELSPTATLARVKQRRDTKYCPDSPWHLYFGERERERERERDPCITNGYSAMLLLFRVRFAVVLCVGLNEAGSCSRPADRSQRRHGVHDRAPSPLRRRQRPPTRE